MQASMTVNVWSLALNDPPTTSPVNTMNCWLRPVLPYQATGKRSGTLPARGTDPRQLITGAFDA